MLRGPPKCVLHADMNYNGCKRKFDVKKYVAKIDTAIRKLKKGKGTGPQNDSMYNYLAPKREA